MLVISFLGRGLTFPFQCIHYLHNNLWRGKCETHESLWVLASGLLGKYWPTIFGGCNHLVYTVQRQGIRKKYGSTPTTTFSARQEIEKKLRDHKRDMNLDQSILTRNIASKKILEKRHIGFMMKRCNQEAL